MVGGLVHEDDVPGVAEHAAEVHAAALTAGELAHNAAQVEIAHELVKDGADAGVRGPRVLRDVAKYRAAHRVGVRELVHLAEIANRDAPAPGHRAGVRLEHVAHDLQQR